MLKTGRMPGYLCKVKTGAYVVRETFDIRTNFIIMDILGGGLWSNWGYETVSM